MDRVRLLRACFARRRVLVGILRAVNKRASVRFSLSVHEMQRGRRREGRFTVLLSKIVWSKKAGEQDEAVESCEKNERGGEFAAASQSITPFESAGRPRKAAYRRRNFRPPGTPTRASPCRRLRKHPSPRSRPPATGRCRASSRSLPATARR